MSVNNRVLVAGAQGVSGRAALEHWRSVPATQVVGLSRRAVSRAEQNQSSVAA